MNMMVLGATGLLGQAFISEAIERDIFVLGVARSGADLALDITDVDALFSALETHRPEVIINCAALVDVGACEADPGFAYRINAAPVATLAQWSRTSGSKLVHISTDHFFAGDGPQAHGEDAIVTLFNQYAATKLAGERFAALGPNTLILRTSIVGVRGRGQPSFAEWAIEAVSHDREMTLFADAFTSSIDTGSFACAALELVQKRASGVFNLAASEVYSKEDFVRRIAHVLDTPLTKAKTGSLEVASPIRPKSLGLDVTRAASMLDHPLPNLQQVVLSVVSCYKG